MAQSAYFVASCCILTQLENDSIDLCTLIPLELSTLTFTSDGPLAKISQARVQRPQQMETKVEEDGGIDLPSLWASTGPGNQSGLTTCGKRLVPGAL